MDVLLAHVANHSLELNQQQRPERAPTNPLEVNHLGEEVRCFQAVGILTLIPIAAVPIVSHVPVTQFSLIHHLVPHQNAENPHGNQFQKKQSQKLHKSPKKLHNGEHQASLKKQHAVLVVEAKLLVFASKG